MSMKLLTRRRAGTAFRYAVHLDDARVIADPADPDATIPDPGAVFEATWTAEPRAQGETLPAFRARLVAFETMAFREFRLLAQHHRAQLDPPEDDEILAGEGEALT